MTIPRVSHTANASLRGLTATPTLPPGPRLPAAAQTYVIWRWPLEYMQWCRDHYGSRFTVRLSSLRPLVFLSNPNDIHAMLAAPTEALRPGEGADMTMPIVGSSSFMLQDDAEHIAGRRAILPPLHGRALEGHEEMVGAIARDAVKTWPRDAPYALHAGLRELTLEVILRKLFQRSGDAPDERLRALRDAMLRMLEITARGLLPQPVLRHTPSGRRMWRTFLRDRADADALVYELIDERRGTPSNDSPNDMLDALLEASRSDGSRLSSQQLRDNVMSLILAGHETTAAQLSWAFQLLAHSPAVLGRLSSEIDRGEDDAYLIATIHEVLRHRPVFLFAIPRVVARPIDIGGFVYRPPMQLLGSIYLLHHDPASYPEPEAFRPERFLSAAPPAYLWLPWGGGRKRCPGLNLALLEMKTILRTVLSHLTVLPAGKDLEHPRWRSVIVTPHAGSQVILRDRKRRVPRRRPSESTP